MLKYFASLLVPLSVLGLLFFELVNTPFYTEGELAAAREKTVDYASEGNFEEAYNRFEALFDIAPDDQKVWGDFIIVLIWDDQEQRALALAEQHLELEQAPLYVIHELFAAYLRAGKPDKALQVALVAMPRSESPEDYALVRSRQLSSIGAVNEARQLIGVARKAAPNSPRLIAARLSIDLNERAIGAEDELRRQLLKYPDSPALKRVEVEGALLRAREGDHEDALAHFARQYRRQPENPKIASDYLTVLSWSGRHAEAVSIWEAHAGEGLAEHALEAAAISLLWHGDIDQAAPILEGLVSDEPDNQRYLRGLAMVDVARGNHLMAVEMLESVVPAEADTLELLGYLYEQRNDPQRAARAFADAFALQTPEQRAYLPWFNAVEAAAEEESIAPYLADTQKYLPGNAGEPVVARYVVLLVSYGQRGLADQLASSYSFSLQQQEPARDPGPEKLSIARLVSINGADAGNISSASAANLASERDQREAAATFDSAPGDRLAKQIQWEAKSARDEGDLAMANRLYRFGVSHYPANRQLQLGLAMGLSEAGNKAEASRRLSQLAQRYPRDAQVQNAAVYHFRKYAMDEELMQSLERLMPLSHGARRDRVLKSWVTTLLSNRVYADTRSQTEALEKIGRYYPDSSRWWLTHALLASRENQCDVALDDLGKVRHASSDRKMLDTAGFSARQCEQYELAKDYYAEGIRRYRNQPALVAGLALNITDGGDPALALETLEPFASELEGERDFLFARAYANAAAGQHEAAITDYETIMRRWPNDKEAFSEYVMSVNHAGNPEEAIRIGQQRDDWLSKKHWQRIHADEATMIMRAADKGDISSVEKQRITEEALLKIDRNIANIESISPVDQAALRSARFDRVSALYIGEQMQRSIDEYQALEVSPQETPAYLLVMVADACMHTNQPEQAIALLREARKRDPGDNRAQAALFYAYLDSEQYGEAERVLNTIQAGVEWDEGVQQETPWQWKLAAMFEAYRNRLDESQRRLESWLVQTPNDNDLRVKLAAVYRWRGWPEKALELYDLVLADDQGSVDARVGKAYAQFQLREYEKVDLKLEELLAELPSNKQVQLVLSDWDVHNRRELDSRIMFGESDGGAFANNELISDTYLYSEPLQHHYRAFAHTYLATADLPGDEGDADVLRVGVGGQYRSRHLIATAEISEALDDDGDLGVTVSGTWLPDDYWIASATVQTYSLLVPVRAINQGIDGESLEVSLKHQWNEGHYLRGAGSYAEFSDDNERRSLYVNHYHRVFENEHHIVALQEQAYWSDNSGGSDVLYFNPEEDYSLGATLLYDGVLSRRYEKKFSHSLAIGIGIYDQQDYGDSFIWDIEYSHTWRRSRFLEWSYGVMHRDRSYDGSGEDFNAVFGRVNWRF